MKKKIMIFISIIALLGIIFVITWISAYNGAIEKNNTVIENRVSVHATMLARYEKVDAFIDAIEGANQTVQGYLNTIMEARSSFANAINNNNSSAADDASELIENTFITLLSYMEDNPDSYNTVNLYSGYMAEFSASTNAVTTAILKYNTSVTDYNNHIEKFPNNLLVGTRDKHVPYEVTNYNASLPTFK